MKLSVSVTRLNEAHLIARAAEIAARRRSAAAAQSRANEVSDGERELGSAAGDLLPSQQR